MSGSPFSKEYQLDSGTAQDYKPSPSDSPTKLQASEATATNKAIYSVAKPRHDDFKARLIAPDFDDDDEEEEEEEEEKVEEGEA